MMAPANIAGCILFTAVINSALVRGCRDDMPPANRRNVRASVGVQELIREPSASKLSRMNCVLYTCTCVLCVWELNTCVYTVQVVQYIIYKSTKREWI